MDPADVHPKDRRRAQVIWTTLLVALLGFTTWLVVDQVKDRNDPSTSITLSDEKYAFPNVYVCLLANNGCDNGYDVNDFCVDSAVTTFAELSYVVYEYTYYVNATVPAESWDGCVKFEMSTFDVGDGDQNRSDPTATSIHMFWKVAEEGSATYSQRVKVYLEDAETLEATAAIHVPYSRLQPNGSDVADLQQTDIMIGRIERNFLFLDSVNDYQPLTVSSTTIKSNLSAEWGRGVSFYDVYNTTNVVGNVKLHITEGALSLTKIDEIDPLDYYEIIGNLGGMWEIILLAWGVFFVASRREDPKLKARNFKKSIQRGTETIAAILPIKRSGRDGQEGFRDRDGGEERPDWDTDVMENGVLSERCNTTNTRHEQSDATDRSASNRRPVLSEVPVRIAHTPLMPSQGACVTPTLVAVRSHSGEASLAVPAPANCEVQLQGAVDGGEASSGAPRV